MQVVHKDALHPQDFEEVSGKVRIKKQPKTYSLNPTRNAELIESSLVVGGNKCRIMNGFGIIHLDFARIDANGWKIAELPSDCPTPLHSMVATTHDGDFVSIEGGTRDIMADVPIKRQYIVDLVGFFNED